MNASRRILIALLASLLFVSGCVSPAEFIKEPGPETAVRFPDYVYDQEIVQDSHGTRAAVQEKGYYLVINNTLYFYDIQSDVVFPLCTKESCGHEYEQTCKAAVFNNTKWSFTGEGEDFIDAWTSNAFEYEIGYYGEHLYMLSCNPYKGLELFQYDPEFSDQKEIAWITDFESEPRTMYVQGTMRYHQGYAYYLTYLYDIDTAWGNPDYQTSYTVCRVKLEEKAEPEELFSFDDQMHGSQVYRLGTVRDDIYCMVEYPISVSSPKDENGNVTFQRTGGCGKLFRYHEKDGAELIWSYEGDRFVGLFEAEGALPRNVHSKDYLINEEGDYVYFAGESEQGEIWATSISAVNLETREGRILYESPYGRIQQLRSDGTNYYFIELGAWQVYLTAIDKEGKLLRRYEIRYNEEYVERMEQYGNPKESLNLGGFYTPRLLVADGRYIVLCGYEDNRYQGLSSPLKSYNEFKYNSVDEGVGVINIEDFLSGKDIELRQIYERTTPL